MMCAIGVITLKWSAPHIERLLSPKFEALSKMHILEILANIGGKIKKISFLSDNISNSYIGGIGGKTWAVLSIILRIISSVLGAIFVIIFAVAFLPMIGLFVLVNFLNRGYWKELEEYREDLIEKAIHKYRDERNLAPSCRVIFRTTKCKKLKNPLSGSWNILRKKVPRLLTADGFLDLVDKLVIKGWM